MLGQYQDMMIFQIFIFFGSRLKKPQYFDPLKV